MSQLTANAHVSTTGGHRPRTGVAAVVTLLLLAATVGAAQPTGATVGGTAPAPRAAASTVAGPIGHEGRWLTDAEGRVVYFHGVNLVAKTPGQTPADMGFDADDAAFLADNGFDAVRLGTTAASLMPQPGVIDEAYLDSFVQSVDVLTDAGLSVLVDLHQDGWGPTLGSDGFPEWMTLTHGAENTETPFPLYYVTNPAIQAAFDSFWANEAGPGGVGLQDRVGEMFTALAERLAGHPGLMGYDLLNEPWPGTTWEPCATDPAGCPEQDKALDAYHERMTTAIRAEDPETMIFGEPYVLFNFGQAPTTVSLPGDDPASGLSYHVYTTDPADDPNVVDFADEWSRATGGALAVTEFGATADTDAIDRQVNLFDGSLTPWMFWAYNENFIKDTGRPPSPDNVAGPVVDTLVRPHPRLVAGTPTKLSYERSDRALRFGYDPAPVGGGTFAPDTTTEIQVAPRTYPEGYHVTVTGGEVTSDPGAALLTVVADGSAPVLVKVWPVGQPEPSDDDAEPTEPTEPTETTQPGETTEPTSPTPTTSPVGSGAGPASPATPQSGRPAYTG